MGQGEIRGIVFDLDGVLIDAADWHYQALNQSLALFGHTISAKEHSLHYNGLPTSVKLQTLSERSDLPRALHPLINRLKQKFTLKILEEKCAVRPDLIALLTHLKKQGLRLGVASNSNKETISVALQGMGVASLFDLVLSHEDVGKAKPDPAIYQESFKRLGTQPSETLVIEDSEPGVRAARSSGAHVWVLQNPLEMTLNNLNQRLQRLTTSNVLEIVVPMAGRGQRFFDAGFRLPKPFIDVFGKPMIEWVVENIRPKNTAYRFTFLIHQEHAKAYRAYETLQRIAPGSRVLTVPKVTQGAACTALLALDSIRQENPLLIVNSDQLVDFRMDDFLTHAEQNRLDGSILTFPSDETKWSYAQTNEEGNVTRVAEKEVISPEATVGIYYFRQARHFTQSAEAMIESGKSALGEFYLCPVYNELIQKGGKVGTFQVPSGAMHGLGTPEDLAGFLAKGLFSVSNGIWYPAAPPS
jgi:HAD superfamily hydrolase (TIGR01509 family)